MTGSQATGLPRISGGVAGLGMTGLESLELESASPEDIINNVEKMLAQEKAKNDQLKGDKKANSKQLDLSGVDGGGKNLAEAAPARRGTALPGQDTAGSPMLPGGAEGL